MQGVDGELLGARGLRLWVVKSLGGVCVHSQFPWSFFLKETAMSGFSKIWWRETVPTQITSCEHVPGDQYDLNYNPWKTVSNVDYSQCFLWQKHGKMCIDL